MPDSLLLQAILQFDARSAINNMGQAAVSFERLRSNANAVTQGAAKLGSGVGRLALGLTPLAIGMGVAVNRAREFEKGIALVQTIADPAEFSTRMLEDSTLALAQTYGTLPVDQTRSMYDAISSGATTAAQAVSIMDDSNKLAVAGGAELSSTLKLMGNIANTYGKQGLSTAAASDILFSSTQYGVMTIAELGSSMGDVIPTAASLGIGFEEINAAMAAATLQGATASEAATGLNMALVNVIKPTKDATDTAKELGLQFDAAAIKTKGFSGFMNDVVQKTGGSEEAITKLFGSVQAFKTVMKLTANEGELFNDVLGKIEKSGNATDVAFEKMSKTMDFQMRQMNANRQVAEVLFGQVMEGGLLRLMSPLSGVLDGIVNILQAVKTGEMTGLSENEIAVANGVRDAIDTVNKSVEWLVKQFSKAKDWITDTFGGETLGAIAKWGTILGVAAVAIVPIGAALAGIGFILPAIGTALAGIGGIISGAFGLILGPIGLVIGAVILFREQLYGIFQGIMEVAGPVFEDLKSIFMATFGEVSRIIGEVVGMFSDGADTMQTDWKEVGRVVGAILGVILTTVAKVAGAIVIYTANLVKGFVELGRAIGETIGSAFITVMQGAVKFSGWIVTAMQAVGLTAPAGLVEFSRQKYEQPRARQPGDRYVKTVEKTSKEEAKARVEQRTESRGALAGVLDELRETSKNSAAAAQSAEAAAKKKPGATHVNINGREVARANAKAEEEVQIRSGDNLTPWQRNRIVVHGARAV